MYYSFVHRADGDVTTFDLHINGNKYKICRQTTYVDKPEFSDVEITDWLEADMGGPYALYEFRKVLDEPLKATYLSPETFELWKCDGEDIHSWATKWTYVPIDNTINKIYLVDHHIIAVNHWKNTEPGKISIRMEMFQWLEQEMLKYGLKE